MKKTMILVARMFLAALPIASIAQPIDPIRRPAGAEQVDWYTGPECAITISRPIVEGHRWF